MCTAKIGHNTVPAMYVDDQDQMYVCPYDPVHVVRASRFNRHLRLCRRNHGGFNFKICDFNQSHHVPEPEFQVHIRTCPDKDRIKQDVERVIRSKDQNILPEPNFHPVWEKPNTGLDWDEEIKEESPDEVAYDGYEEEYEDEDEYWGKQNGINNVENGYEEEEPNNTAQPFIEELLPEKPANWETMNAVQKKNYKRKYKRQQERLKSSVGTGEDIQKQRAPEEWTDKERKQRIQAILSKYPLLRGKTAGAFVDYKSILNQYCQKEYITAPIYRPCVSDVAYGGFGAECIVKSEVYKSRGYHKTKKEADHNAAYWTLLKMPITLEDSVEKKPHGVRTAAELQKLREGDELRRLGQSGHLPTSTAKAPIRQPGTKPLKAPPPLKPTQEERTAPVLIPPNAFKVSKTTPKANGAQLLTNMLNMSLKEKEEKAPVDDGWTTVSSKKAAGVKSAGRSTDAGRATGTGRGRGRGRGTALGPL